jgi:hypothetical protein
MGWLVVHVTNPKCGVHAVNVVKIDLCF